MNKQRKVVITTTYNEMGIIIDTKTEELGTSAQLGTDRISRQAAIMDAESWVAVDEHEEHLQKNVVEWLKEFPPAQPEELDTLIKDLKEEHQKLIEMQKAQSKPHWIPVAERLPDREGRYLVSNGQIGDWVTDIDFWIHKNNRMQWKYGKKVLAWMPLPEPWEGDAE